MIVFNNKFGATVEDPVVPPELLSLLGPGPTAQVGPAPGDAHGGRGQGHGQGQGIWNEGVFVGVGFVVFFVLWTFRVIIALLN